jgi:chitinase
LLQEFKACKMKLPLILSVLILHVISPVCQSQPGNQKASANFKVVGYYFLNAVLRYTTAIDTSYAFLDKITHLNLAFINPDTAGNFRQDLNIVTFIEKAHSKNVKVLASIAGGGSHAYYARLLQADQRPMLIIKLVSLVTRYNLDGVDVDLEGDDIDSNHEAFVTELGAALRPLGKLMTAAIATAYKDKLTDKAMQQFDFLNIMSYDGTGPWSPQRPGQHSPYSLAEEDLKYWNKTRNIPKEKLVVGLPFYGYGFGTADEEVLSMSYKDIVAANPASVLADTLLLPGNKIMYYNGAPTIKKKTALAVKKAGGVMIWQLLGDAPAENSLLNVIDGVIHER